MSGEADPAAEPVEHARRIIASACRLVALTGAGISTEAGIPDFRGPSGIWTKDPAAERLSTLSHYLEEEQTRRRSWASRLGAPVWSARPTAGHAALVELERRGVLHTIVTQNTDGLHQLAGSSPERVVEIHGTSHLTICWSCGDRQPTLSVLERVRAGDTDPRCEKPRGDALCGGILKTATVSFGQSLDQDDLERARRAAARCDVLLAIGTTLEVQPVAGMVPIAKRSGARILILNRGPTPYDTMADVVVSGRIGEILPVLAA